MFSLDNYYNVITKNLIDPIGMGYDILYPNGIIESHSSEDQLHRIYFNDQEPFSPTLTHIPFNNTFYNLTELGDYYDCVDEDPIKLRKSYCRIYATSEKNTAINDLVTDQSVVNWYYFSHGLITQHWFRDYKYLPPSIEYNFDKVFITFNNIVSNNRSYRLSLVSQLLEKQLDKYGHISFLSNTEYGTWQDEIYRNPYSRLSNYSKQHIEKNLQHLHSPLIIDVEKTHGALSAGNDLFVDLKTYQSGFWHLVTETIFYDHSLHLTEKIFKPIVSKRPFILVGAPGNLEYLKGYGFKTFSDYIDESYDQEVDPDKRIAMIVKETERLCNMSDAELRSMHKDMQSILEYNFNWFYNDFKHIVIDEMLRNYRAILLTYNQNNFPGNRLPIENLNFPEIAKRLGQ